MRKAIRIFFSACRITSLKRVVCKQYISVSTVFMYIKWDDIILIYNYKYEN